MKKFLLVLGMVTCIFGVTACGSEEAPAQEVMELSEEGAIAYADQIVDALGQIVAGGMQEQYADDPVVSAAIAGWESAISEIGETWAITDHVVTAEVESATIDVTIDGSEHDATVTILLDKQGNLTGVSTNVIKSFGELMVNAALNTLLGMGTVFIVLILIAGLISCFKFIPMLQKKFSGKKKAAAPAAAPAPVAAPVVEVEEEDDLELVAVIAAAIAASEGATSTDGFVVRSIKRRGNKWQKA